MLAFFLILISGLLGVFGFLRTGQRVRWVILAFFGVSMFYSIAYMSMHPYPKETYLTPIDILETKLLPIQAKMILAYALGEIGRLLFIMAFGDDKNRGPTPAAQLTNKFGSKIFNSHKFNTGKDHDLRSAIDVSIWLYLDICKDRRKLTTAIGRENDLSTDDRISLMQEIIASAAIPPSKKPPILSFKKRHKNDENAKQTFYADMVKIGVLSGTPLDEVKPKLKVLAEELNVDLVRAQGIVETVIAESTA